MEIAKKLKEEEEAAAKGASTSYSKGGSFTSVSDAIEAAVATAPRRIGTAFQRFMARRVDLDHIFRWFFPLAYAVFCAVMFSIHGQYAQGKCSVTTVE